MSIFKNFPDHSKIWIYASPKPLMLEEHEYITAELENFMDEWAAHGAKLKADFTILYKRFIVVVVDEENQSASGCSIDSCVKKIQAIGSKLNIDFFNRLLVIYRDENNNMVVGCTIAELKEMIAEHDFPNSTPVFNNAITTLGELRTSWEIPATKSWIAKYFKSINV